MKRLISIILCVCLVATLFTGCGGTDIASDGAPVASVENDSSVDNNTSTASGDEDSSDNDIKDAGDSGPDESAEASTSAAPATIAPVEEARFEFQPKVCSSFIEETLGKDKCDAWFSLVDAVMAGKNTFKCKDNHTYIWMMNTFPDMCFPVLRDLIEPSDDFGEYVKKGKAKFKYTVPRKKAAKKIKKFMKLVEDILNETLEPDYSDFEKALALYVYFAKTYTYDYDTFDLLQEEPLKTSYVCAYRIMTKKTGICAEAAVAYSYLLMQAGVDASVVSNADHEWSIIKLGKKYYHIDPTYVLDCPDIPLQYFMMNDKHRCTTGDFVKNEFEYVSQYIPEEMPDYSAKSKAFKPLWEGYYISFDHETKKLKYMGYDEDFNKKELEFDYSKYYTLKNN